MRVLYNNLFFLVIAFLISGCSKDSLVENPLPKNPLPDYLPFTIGSTFNFKGNTGSYINSVMSDTVIFGKIYKKVMNTNDINKTYYIHQNGDYKISGVSPLHASGLSVTLNDFLFLKGNANVNATWSVSVPVSSGALKYTARFDYKILAKDTTHTINNQIYKDVIKVEQKVVNIYGTEELAAGSNLFWYAKQIGLIESTSMKTQLMSYSIK